MRQKKQYSSKYKTIILAAAAVILVITGIFAGKIMKDRQQTSGTADSTSQTKEAGNTAKEVVDSDIVIPINEVTENVRFYPAQINGTKMEVLAVKAPDGTIRTAFNTCQVCYDSGKGYYKQEGDKLVCQNCGNSFGMGDVEVAKNGCNPVGITDEYKTTDNGSIVISKDILAQATGLFANWKK